MILSKALPEYGGKKINIANKLSLSSGGVSHWDEKTPIPELQALLIERNTKGKVPYDPELYGRNKEDFPSPYLSAA